MQLTFEAVNGECTSISDFLGKACCDAFLVVHDGRVIAEHYFNGMTASSHHLLNSVTKCFVGMLAGIAVDRDQLEPSSLITRCLPDLDGAAWQGTTVRHLLDMTAGVRYAENYADPQTDFWKEASVVGWRPALVSARTPRNLLDYARSLDGQDVENGSMFQYRTVCTSVLGMILERAMGARHAALNGRQVVPAPWVTDTVQGDATSKECFAKGIYGDESPGWHFRNQVWVPFLTEGQQFIPGT